MPYEVTVGGGGYFVRKLLETIAGSPERAQLLCVGKVMSLQQQPHDQSRMWNKLKFNDPPLMVDLT